MSVLEGILGVVGRPGSTSWCTPMRFYKVFGVKTGPMGLKAKKYYFPHGISMNLCSRGTQNCSPGTQNCSPGAQHSVLEAGLSVLEAGLGGPERHLGDYCMLLNGLGRFQNALGTFQELSLIHI